VVEREQPDAVVIVNLPDVYDAVARLRARGKSALRTVMTIHALESDFFAEARELGSALDAVICTNRLACRLVEVGSGVPASRVHYAPCGVELPPWRGIRPPGDRLEILWAGRLDERAKRVSDLPRIVKALEWRGVQFRLTVAGDGPDEAALRESLSNVRTAAEVRFLGRVAQAELVAKVLPAQDAFLLTSPRETGPIAAWEAMAAGVAVVSSRYLGSGLEGALVDRETCRLFEVGDAEAAAHCLLDVADAAVRAELALAGRRLVESRYSQEVSVSAWRAALRAALAAPHPPTPPATRAIPPAGRLDRWLGGELAESLRELFGREFVHAGPGGEWPHSYGQWSDEASFLDLARRLDRGEG